MKAALLVTVLGLFVGASARKPTTVAVLSFQNLSEGQKGIGEAIRETVTLDLRDVSELRVVERVQIDKVLEELKLQSSAVGASPASSSKVGKLLGADLLVLGAFQRTEGRVRLTARFVRTETGEVMGTAKVDGEEGELLLLQDRITGELLKSAGLAERAVARSRPLLASLEPVNLFGQALSEPEDRKKRALLAEAAKTEPAFNYAKDALSVVEKRIRDYEAKAVAAQRAELERLQRLLPAAKTAMERSTLRGQMDAQLRMLGRLHTMERLLREDIAFYSRSREPHASTWRDVSLIQRLALLQQLGRHDELLAEGERFMQANPTSLYFQSAQNFVNNELRRRRDEATEAGRLDEELGRLRSQDRWDLCRLGSVYRRARQLNEAERMYAACVRIDPEQREHAYPQLLEVLISEGKWAKAREVRHAYETEAPLEYEKMRSMYEMRIPSDD